MAFEEIKVSISQIEEGIQAYIEHNREYYKLKAFKLIMKGVTSLVRMLCIIFIALLAILFLSFAASYWIGRELDSIFYGFLIVGLFYVLLGILFWALRKLLEKPLLKKYSTDYFD